MVSKAFLCQLPPVYVQFQYIINIITSLLYDQACHLNVACGFATIDKAVYSEKCFMQAEIDAFTTFLLIPFVFIQVVCAACEG